MTSKIIHIMFGLFCSFNAFCDNTFVSPFVDQVETQRMGDYLFRYISFSTESDFPCLRFELLQPEQNYEVVTSQDLCSFDNKSFKSGYSYVGFSDFKMKGNQFNFTLITYELTVTGEFQRSCSTSVKGKEFTPLSCSEPTEIP